MQSISFNQPFKSFCCIGMLRTCVSPELTLFPLLFSSPCSVLVSFCWLYLDAVLLSVRIVARLSLYIYCIFVDGNMYWSLSIFGSISVYWRYIGVFQCLPYLPHILLTFVIIILWRVNGMTCVLVFPTPPTRVNFHCGYFQVLLLRCAVNDLLMLRLLFTFYPHLHCCIFGGYFTVQLSSHIYPGFNSCLLPSYTWTVFFLCCIVTVSIWISIFPLYCSSFPVWWCTACISHKCDHIWYSASVWVSYSVCVRYFPPLFAFPLVMVQFLFSCKLCLQCVLLFPSTCKYGHFPPTFFTCEYSTVFANCFSVSLVFPTSNAMCFHLCCWCKCS